MKSYVRFLTVAVCLAVGSFAVRPAVALEPAEVAVIYNSASDESLELAKYYMKARGIPENNLIPINYLVKRGNSAENTYLRAKENITEAEYRRNIVPQIQRVLAEKKLDQPGGVKCLVTTYDVPLRIGAYLSAQAEHNKYKEELEKIVDTLEEQLAVYERIAAPPPPPPPATEPATAPASQPATAEAAKPKREHWSRYIARINKGVNDAGKRIEKLPPEQRDQAMAELRRVQQRNMGLTGLLAIQIHGTSEAAEANRQERVKIEASVKAAETKFKELAGKLDQPVSQREFLDLSAKTHGLLGRARTLDLLAGFGLETEACFDNELALVLAADQNYSRGRWMANPRNVTAYRARRGVNVAGGQDAPRTIMVCRVDGQTVEKAKEMIDRSLEIEAKGLDGKMYLDARGITTGGYASLDIQMRRLNEWMKTHSTMECVLDDHDAMFKAENCPDAALYCGWYSLYKYVDVCQWLPGAVGYHVASGEMESLHKHNNTQWVVNLLNRGFCGTLGPTGEPYLTAFPNPAHFFPLLLCGEFTQGEVWEVTAPMLSWHVGFVGDPLYNPFKNNPKAKVEDVKKDPILRNAFLMLRPEKSQQPVE